MKNRAFTLVELMIVVVMVSLLAAVVSPGLTAVRGTQQAAGTDDVRRMLRTAQQLARASGRPHGVWVDAANEKARMMQLQADGTVAPALDGLGEDTPIRPLLEDFAGLELTDVDPGDGNAVSEAVLWFNYLGRPETRDADGSNAQLATTEPTLTFVGFAPIVIDRVTGVSR
ncbi:MAG: type II secretion system protein H [Phycisphaerales bacterium]|jgi:type II secretion system protein H